MKVTADISASKNVAIDAYIDRAKPFAIPILIHLRELIHEACPQVEETIKWSRPFFLYRGVILCNISAFNEHCSFGFWGEEIAAVLREANALQPGAMGSLGRIASLRDLPGDKRMLAWLRQAAGFIESGNYTSPVKARNDKARNDNARNDEAKSDEAGNDKAGNDKTRRTEARQTRSRQTGLRQTKARITESSKTQAPRLVKASEDAPEGAADFLEAISGNKEASAGYAKLSPSCKREYLEWITTAKRAETRAKRIATALSWIAEGKQRHWKYQL